jgi:hypothetical protein
MGNDLYWKPTPKPESEELQGLYMDTWYRLAEIFGRECDDLNGWELDKTDLDRLNLIWKTIKAMGTAGGFETDLHELINAINKYDSITLVVRG